MRPPKKKPKRKPKPSALPPPNKAVLSAARAGARTK
jgi:hypothetical protein